MSRGIAKITRTLTFKRDWHVGLSTLPTRYVIRRDNNMAVDKITSELHGEIQKASNMR